MMILILVSSEVKEFCELGSVRGGQQLLQFVRVKPEAVAARAFVIGLSQQGENVTAECRTIAELNQVIDLLRRNNVEITSVTRQRSTLEDSFISLITGEGRP